ncbi:hypothetical protein AB0J80_01190 [Actinoplanes sp. NPDC049548]|uniref:hypothetical protein n=1 Tax=Actinoplanes sp. NPDC049548 TaxID=3155152 RepID=UPI003431DCD7
MRHRRAAMAVAALTLLGVAACSDDADDKGPASVTPGVSAGASPSAVPGTSSAAPGESPAAPGGKPTEGTASKKPPKKGGGAVQGPAGRG